MVSVKRRTRTLLLGLSALLALLYGLLIILEVPAQEVAALVMASVIIVLGTAVIGFVFAAIVYLIRRRGK